MIRMIQTKAHAIIIGAGFTGCALAYDLARRGLAVTVLDRGEIASGTSGRTHGLLHSGARYCVNDQESAVECIQENMILRKIAHQCIEYNGGFFVALNEQDLAYGPRFEVGAQQCGIEIDAIAPQKARQLEPNLNPDVLAVYHVPDGVFDPLRLALAFAASARFFGAEFLPYHEVENFLTNGQGAVSGIKFWNRLTNSRSELTADLVVNATGAWAGVILKKIGASVVVTPTPGIMVAYDCRLVNRVINRLNEPGDGDILIPQRRMVVIGTTSYEAEEVDYIPVEKEQAIQMNRDAITLVPRVATCKQRGVYMSARPLIGKGEAGRSLARTFKCFDHRETDGIEGLVTITGGKATTCRLMAEKTADLVCQKLGISAVCETAGEPLRSYREYYQPSGANR
jgi:glycerol-3-phosphate dehydrogenase|uniref:FAD-dependent oxidoreductase n=1 Tax=Anaerolinea thermolimosa TaxID=229919 RepID=A0A7C4KHV9_9CHLR